MGSTRELDPRFRPYATALMTYLRKLDPLFTINSAVRTRAQQQALYDAWKRGENPFPVAPPGHSAHELGLAIDVGRIGHDPNNDAMLWHAGYLWRAHGLAWGGSADPVHFGLW